jgi:nucleotide-binding universal stress UspA family protein
MKRIVIGYDATKAADHALERGAELAKLFGAEVIVASVAPVLVGAGRGIGPIDPADPPERHEAQARLAVEKLAQMGITAETVTGMGDPAHTIADLAERREADLVVVGTGEKGAIERLVHGSVSTGLAHKAPCDVLIVH